MSYNILCAKDTKNNLPLSTLSFLHGVKGVFLINSFTLLTLC